MLNEKWPRYLFEFGDEKIVISYKYFSKTVSNNIVLHIIGKHITIKQNNVTMWSTIRYTYGKDGVGKKILSH